MTATTGGKGNLSRKGNGNKDCNVNWGRWAQSQLVPTSVLTRFNVNTISCTTKSEGVTACTPHLVLYTLQLQRSITWPPQTSLYNGCVVFCDWFWQMKGYRISNMTAELYSIFWNNAKYIQLETDVNKSICVQNKSILVHRIVHITLSNHRSALRVTILHKISSCGCGSLSVQSCSCWMMALVVVPSSGYAQLLRLLWQFWLQMMLSLELRPVSQCSQCLLTASWACLCHLHPWEIHQG